MKTKRSFTKKVFAILTAVMLIFSILSIPTLGSAAAYDETGATTFTFSDGGITAKDGDYTGYKIEGNALTISKAGTYVLTGTSSDGSVKVKKGTVGVTLVLDNLDLTSSDTAPISCNKSSEVTIILKEGTTNTLTDSEKNNDETYPDNTEAENAVIKCKDGSKVVIGGTGTLNIVSNGKNGMKGGATTEEEGEASLTIEDLTLNITANVNDALKADNGLFIKSGTVTIEAADDAIKSDYDLTIGEEGKDGPTINVTKSYEGIEAANLVINSGDISVTSSDDGMNAANSDLKGYSFSLTINGGKIYVNADGDGIDSNGALTINGGYVEVYAASRSDNSPYDSDGALSINGGTVIGVGHAGMTRTPSGTQSHVTFGSSGFGGFGGFGQNMSRGTNQNTDATTGAIPQVGNGNTKGGKIDRDNRSGEMREMPDFGNGERPEMPDFESGEMPTPPDFGNGERPQMPDFENGEMPTPSDFGNGEMPDFGQMSGTGSVSLTKGQSFEIVDAGGNVVYTGTATRNADYVFYSSEKVKEGDEFTLKVGGSEVATATASASGNVQSPSGFFGGNGQNPTEAMTGDPSSPEHGNSGKPSSGQSGNSSKDGKGKRYKDIEEGTWYEEAVSYVTDESLMNGTGEETFSPNLKATRGMFITVLYRLENEPEVSGNISFKDVSETDYYYNAVRWGVEQGIVQGMSHAAFAPNATLNREQMATFVSRYLRYKGVTGEGEEGSYQDADSISDYAKDAVSEVSADGILEGDENGNFLPQKDTTRAEIATVLMRTAKKLK